MNALILTAAGSSTRMGGTVKKEYLTLSEDASGRISVLSQALFKFLDTRFFSFIVITVPKAGETEARAVLAADPRIALLLEESGARVFFAQGGDSRQASVLCGLEALVSNTPSVIKNADIVLIHDAARPYVTAPVIRSVLETAAAKGAAVPAIPPVDTEKEIDANGRIVRHLDRSSIVAVQTPQGFLLAPLVEAHRKAALDGKTYTDDTEIWGRYEGDVWVCPGERENKKITYSGDIL